MHYLKHSQNIDSYILKTPPPPPEEFSELGWVGPHAWAEIISREKSLERLGQIVALGMIADHTECFFESDTVQASQIDE